MGTVIGELSLYLGTTRAASVISDLPTIAYRLIRTAMSEMKEKEPELATTFEFVARLLSERLAAPNRSLEAALK
jgi:hypothetical protein